MRTAPAAPRSSFAEKRARNRPIREAQRAAAEQLADDDVLNLPAEAANEPVAADVRAEADTAPLAGPAAGAPDAGDFGDDAAGEDESEADETGEDAPAPRKRRTIEGPVENGTRAGATGRAKSRGKRDRSAAAEPVGIDALVEAARKSLDDDKAEEIVVLDVTGRADYADRLIIASGLADRQIQAMAQHLEEALEQAGLRRRLRFEGLGSSDWVLVDAGDLWIHLFKPEARQAYGLERMWGPDSPSAEDVVVIGESGAPSAAAEPSREQSDGED